MIIYLNIGMALESLRGTGKVPVSRERFAVREMVHLSRSFVVLIFFRDAGIT